jgi:riboflavin biosynthesis pyrimidine reductase
VRQLIPAPVDAVDPLELYPAAARRAPVDRPWLMINMIASADGATELGGVSGGLGGPADRLVFRAIRATADWIVAAAGTVRAERYGLPRLPDAAREMRTAAGRPPDPRLAVVSGSLDLELDLPLFADQAPGELPPLVITGTGSAVARRARLEAVAEVAVIEEARPTAGSILAELQRRGASIVLSEGGPGFNGQLTSAGLVDELCVSISPLLVGGPSARIVVGSTAVAPTAMRLDLLLEQDGLLFARYVRQ